MSQTSITPARLGMGLGHPSQQRHIVDTLIEERARHLRSRPATWALIKTFIYPLLHYRAAHRMADHIAPLGGRAIFDWFLGEIAPKVDVVGLEHVPASGRCVIVANHPTGIVDGIALYGAMKPIRTDLCFLANRDALRVAPLLDELIVPVEWVIEKRSLSKTREMWRMTKAAFDAEKAVVVFPSGRVAQLHGRRLVDRPWHATTINIARRNDAVVVPLHISAWNSFIYYFFARVSQELRDMTLFNELLNKRGKAFRLTFGPPIFPDQLSGEPEAEILRLRQHIEHGLPRGEIFR